MKMSPVEVLSGLPVEPLPIVLGFPLSHRMANDGLQLVRCDFARIGKIDLMVSSDIGQIELVTIF